MTTMRVVGECFFWYRLTRVFPDKFHRAVKRLCVCVCGVTTTAAHTTTILLELGNRKLGMMLWRHLLRKDAMEHSK